MEVSFSHCEKKSSRIAIKKFSSDFSSADKIKGLSSRYINDFNATSPFEPIYDYDNTKTEIDKVPFHQDATKNDDSLDIIYPDPMEIHRKMLNKSRMENHHDDTVIKICKFFFLWKVERTYIEYLTMTC